MDRREDNTIKDVFERYCHEKPETILLRIKEFISKEGRAYRRGLMTEEEFLIATHFGSVYRDLWHLKNQLVIEENSLQNTSFLSSYEEWKTTGKTKNTKWLFEVCSQFGNPAESILWFFKVIDTLLIPPRYFIGIQDVDKFPNIIYVNDSDSVRMLLSETCIGTNMVKGASYQVGDRLTLKYYSGDVVDLMISEIKDSVIVGQGTIKNYMNSTGKIVIFFDENGQNPEVYFNEKRFSQYKVLMGTYIYPIPHPKWKRYENARLTRQLLLEAEYKILRLPYMIGSEEAAEPDFIKEKISDKTSKAHIFRFSP